MLTEPRPALAEQSTFHHALVGLAGLARLVCALAPVGPPPGGPRGEPDDFVHLLLGVVSLGGTVDQLGRPREHPEANPADDRRVPRTNPGGCDDQPGDHPADRPDAGAGPG